jgi:NADH-quinone oxidoreductase subunit N
MLNTIAAIGLPFIPGWHELRPFIADLILIGTIVAILITPFFTRPQFSNAAAGVVALAGVCIAFLALLVFGTGAIGLHFRGLLVSDNFAWLWKCLLMLFTAGVIVMWFVTSMTTMHEGDGPEFFTLLIGAALGMSLMASTSNLLMLVITVEMASLPSYVLAGFRKTHRIGAEASLKYVLFGAVTSAIMIYGVSILYGLYGTLQAGELARQMLAGGNASAALLVVAFLGLIVGIGFKISAVPFHFWCPDVFEGAGIDVATFLSVASKGGALALLLRVLMEISTGLSYSHHTLTVLAIVLGILGAITATVGNTAAFVQNNIKRLLAYSSIAHAGYMLCALSLLVKHEEAPAAVSSGSILAVSPAQAILLYLAVYLFMNLGAFTVAGLIWRTTGSEDIRDYAALGRRAPLLALCMTVFMFSLIGLPPLAGFAAKLNLMYVLARNGGWWWALVAVIGINTVFSLYYYVRVVKLMYLTESDAPEISPNPIGVGLALANAVILLVLFLGWSPLNRLTTTQSRMYLSASDTAKVVAAPASRVVDVEGSTRDAGVAATER